MAYKVQVTDSAAQDIDEILAYISINLAAPQAAAAFADELDHHFELLEDQPFLFAASTNIRLRRRGYRRFPVKNYVVFYLVDEAAQIVNIARVFYGGQDYEKYL
jgi:toxin ParE1/3/4